MTKKFARGTHAVAICQRCGRKLKYLDLKFDGYMPDLRVCAECYDPPEPLDDGWKGSATVIPRRALPPPDVACPPSDAPAGPYASDVCLLLSAADINKFTGGIEIFLNDYAASNVYIRFAQDLTITPIAVAVPAIELRGFGADHWVWIDTSRLTLNLPPVSSDPGYVPFPPSRCCILVSASNATSAFDLRVANSRLGRTGTINGAADHAIGMLSQSPGHAEHGGGPIFSGTVQILSGASGITGFVDNQI